MADRARVVWSRAAATGKRKRAGGCAVAANSVLAELRAADGSVRAFETPLAGELRDCNPRLADWAAWHADDRSYIALLVPHKRLLPSLDPANWREEATDADANDDASKAPTTDEQ